MIHNAKDFAHELTEQDAGLSFTMVGSLRKSLACEKCMLQFQPILANGTGTVTSSFTNSIATNECVWWTLGNFPIRSPNTLR
jgi:hypothetical protein